MSDALVPLDLENEDLETAVYLAIGAASACWDNLEGAGAFESDKARDIGDQLLEKVRSYVR